MQIKTEVNQLLTQNPAHISGDSWYAALGSVQSGTLAQSFFNALPAETARWKRCMPRYAPINVLIAMDFYLHSLQVIGKVDGRGLNQTLTRRFSVAWSITSIPD